MRPSSVAVRPIAGALAVLAVAAATPSKALAQDSSATQSQSQSDDAQGGSGSGSGENGGEESFLQSVMPDFLKGWFGMEESGSGGSSQSASGGQGGGQGSGQQQVPAVVVARAEVQSVGERFEFIGRIQSIQQVALQARVAGFIQDVFFKGGDTIKAGDKLFQIEPAEYEANLQAAQAQLTSAQAQESQAERSLQRNQELAGNGTVSQAQLDDARATFETARGTRLQAEAQVRQAQLALDYTSITAPIDGQISEPLITKGNYVTVSSGALANLIQSDPIWGTFPIGENRLATWRRVGMDGGQARDADQVADYRLSLILPNEEEYRADGSFSFVSNTVNAATGTIDVRVEFPNPQGILLPDQNVTLVASEKDPPRQPVIPQAAVQLSREGRSVYVLNDDDTVRKVPVEVGKQLRGSVAIASGLQGGEYVVVQGMQNISEGAKVKPSVQEPGSDQPGTGQPGGEGAASGNAAGSSAEGQQGEGQQAAGEAKGEEGPDNAAQQNIGGQSRSETEAAIEGGAANKVTPTGPTPQSEPRPQAESNSGGDNGPNAAASDEKSGGGASGTPENGA